MQKKFNTTGVCIPEEHYMVNIESRMAQIKKLIDDGKYFTINRARQYGKTTMLMGLRRYLQNEYNVVFMDFQMFGSEDFKSEHGFSYAFAQVFADKACMINGCDKGKICEKISELLEHSNDITFTLRPLFRYLGSVLRESDKPFVLLIDEVDSASDNQVFIDFLAQLRAQYMDRFTQPSFKSVILAGVYDIKNLRRKIRSNDEHKYNSPWNIAADFNVEMSFSQEDIAGMLSDYEHDHHTGMDIKNMSDLLYSYTSGYPFLVSRLCQLIDGFYPDSDGAVSRSTVNEWTKYGLEKAIKILLAEKNTLFESLIIKLHDYPSLNTILQTLLFTGKSIAYNSDDDTVNIATMFGFIKNKNGNIAVANRIFEVRLYNYYLSTVEMQSKEIYNASVSDKNQFICDGYLNMRRVLEKFAAHFNDIYGAESEDFLEEEGRKYFLLYLRPIINGTGNYYIEAQTRDQRRTDVIVDYNGEQYVIEMKIWRGKEYNSRGETQLADYLDYYHTDTGYMVSFNFNKTKKPGVYDINIGDKHIIEAVV